MLKSMTMCARISCVFPCLLALNASVATLDAAPDPRPALTEAEVDARLTRMRELCGKNKLKEVVEQFKDDDFAAWLPVFKDKTVAANKAVEALNFRGTCFAYTKDPVRAEKDFTFALELNPTSGYLWNSLGGVYSSMKEEDKALDAYNKAFEYECGPGKPKSYGWMPISATLSAASILVHRLKCPEALKTLERYNDEDIRKMDVYWAGRVLRAYGQVYLAMGREEEGLAKYKAALELENKKGE